MNQKTKKYISYAIGGLIVWFIIIKIIVSLGVSKMKEEYTTVKKGVKSNTKDVKEDIKSIKE